MDLQVGSASKFWVKKNGNGALITTDGVGYNLFGTGSFGGSPTSTTNGIKIQLVYNDTNNRQFWIGGTDASAFGLRLVSTNTSVIVDGDTSAIGGTNKLSFLSGFYVGGVSSGAMLVSSGTAHVLEQRDGTNSQTHHHYDTYASSTDYHRLAIKTARATLASVNGATVTATNLIPDGAIVVGVTAKVTVTISGGTTTGFQVGTAGDPDRWGEAVALTAGTSLDNTNWTAGTIEAFTAATNVIVTPVGGNFTGTGTIYLSVQYLIGQCD
jgi:hypothetical protein